MTPTAKEKKLKTSREDRAFKRTVDPKFVAAERAARNRYAKRRYQFTKWAMAFARAYPELFAEFKVKAVASPPLASQRMFPWQREGTQQPAQEKAPAKAEANKVDIAKLLGLA